VNITFGQLRYAGVAVAKRTNYTGYLSKDGILFKMGDRIKLGMPSNRTNFVYIRGYSLDSNPMQSQYSGREAEIKWVQVTGDLFKRTGNRVIIITRAIDLVQYEINVEMALQSGELLAPGITSDEALAELKKAKDKLDLGLISQSKYDSLKAELSKHIK
jgi:hypothetical protein